MKSDKKTFLIYRNLNNGQLSIKSKDTGLVVGHCQRIILESPIFKVSHKGILRIRKNKQKSVVAMVQGSIYHIEGFISYKNRTCGLRIVNNPPELNTPVFFDPYKWDGSLMQLRIFYPQRILLKY